MTNNGNSSSSNDSNSKRKKKKKTTTFKVLHCAKSLIIYISFNPLNNSVK